MIEVLISIMLVAIICSSFLSVALTGRMSAERVKRRAAALFAVRRVSEALKAYVTADPALAAGPGGGFDGWRLPGDQSGLSALAAGRHPLDPVIWAAELAPVSGRVEYDVAVRMTPSGPEPTVTFKIGWDEP